jgi:hypothetical protein
MYPMLSKHALLICPFFFEYHIAIRNELERRGYSVDTLPDRLATTAYAKAFTRLLPGLTHLPYERWLKAAIAQFGRSSYDKVLVVVGESMSFRCAQWLRSAFPSAKLVFYSWDSFNSKPRQAYLLPAFDTASTFDPNDSARYGMRLRPLFYTPQPTDTSRQPTRYRLSFIGTAHSDRYSVVRSLRTQFSADETFFFLYLQARWVFFAYKTGRPSFWGARQQEFSFSPLSSVEVNAVFCASFAILDIEHPGQVGLTIRTLEALGAGKKLVTTNRSVADYDFYSPDRVQIIDRKSGLVKRAFFDDPASPLADGIVARYSVSHWLTDVLNCAPHI